MQIEKGVLTVSGSFSATNAAFTSEEIPLPFDLAEGKGVVLTFLELEFPAACLVDNTDIIVIMSEEDVSAEMYFNDRNMIEKQIKHVSTAAGAGDQLTDRVLRMALFAPVLIDQVYLGFKHTAGSAQTIYYRLSYKVAKFTSGEKDKMLFRR